MKISVWSHGDPSVGINGDNAEIEIIDGDYLNGDRDMVRAVLKDAFSQIFDDGNVTVAFSDELAESICEYAEKED